MQDGRFLKREACFMPRYAIGAAAMIVGVGVVWLVVLGCGMAEPAPGKPKGDGFAADRVNTTPLAFDAPRAMEYLTAVCKIGPRMSGTDGMKKQQELLQKHFEDLGGKVAFQRFTGKALSEGKDVEMANIIVSWHPEKTRRVILCSHYDTRPIADQEPNRRRWHDPFVSANDGGSGVALLMEMANHMKDLDANVGVDFVLFDGEEYVFDPQDKYFLGSEEFARQYRKSKDKARYLAAVLLDMVGGKNAKFPMEQKSYWKAPQLTQELWKTADELGCTAFRSTEFSRFEVEDDHVPLNNAGIPAVDIIDFSYTHWHRLTDVPENCSGDSLEQVARVLGVWVQRVK
jgi:glutaminyl-peptide cyclotransferase